MTLTTKTFPRKEIRAVYDANTIRVYQAFSTPIAKAALEAQTFVSPPFSLTRMTWIKPSFLWMMYRAGYGFKDNGQNNILAIEVTHEGFRWALEHSCESHRPEDMSKETWAKHKSEHPVRIQWDPERDILHNALSHRSIQIGLSGEAVNRYVGSWITEITDITPIAHKIHGHLQAREIELAEGLCPNERPYDLLACHGHYGRKEAQ